MALADTGKAIGSVTRALQERLNALTGLNISVGRPEAPSGTNPRLNLFLYEANFDPHLRNTPLDAGQSPPLWLVLKFLLTAYDVTGISDNPAALDLLGEGARALQQASVLTLDHLLPATSKALTDNPEELRITFDEAPVDLISKVMQGSDEKYRLALGFQVRPVMIAAGDAPAYSLLVGIDYTTAPDPTVIGADGINIPVIPSLGPTITRVTPESFETGAIITIEGTDLHLSNLSVKLGPLELPIVAQRADQLTCLVSASVVKGDAISAGNHPLVVEHAPAGARRRQSNMLVANLLPTLDTVTIVPGSLNGTTDVDATLDLAGLLLGGDDDDVFLALYRNGQTVKLFDAFMKDADIPAPPPPPPVPAQTRKRLVMPTTVPAGDYLIILRVNGQQARKSPLVKLAP